MNYFIECLTSKYFCFSGRARRQEYWMFWLFCTLGSILLQFVCGFLVGITGLGIFGVLPLFYALAVLIPHLAVSVRRLHDIGKSGLWLFILLVPIAGAIVILVFDCLDSQPGSNEYGPNPKGL